MTPNLLALYAVVGNRSVQSTPYEKFKKLRGGHEVPLFEDVVKQFGRRTMLDIELKEKGIDKSVNNSQVPLVQIPPPGPLSVDHVRPLHVRVQQDIVTWSKAEVSESDSDDRIRSERRQRRSN